MLSDNLGWATVGYHRAVSPAGPSPEVQTPNIDGLVRSGIELDRFCAPPLTPRPPRPPPSTIAPHVTSPRADTYKFCSPSRSAFLSGRLPIHVNFHNSDQRMPGAGIPLGMTTIAQKLKGVGYRTHQIGKWYDHRRS